MNFQEEGFVLLLYLLYLFQFNFLQSKGQLFVFLLQVLSTLSVTLLPFAR